MKLLKNETAEKILGIVWENSKDAFSFKVNADISTLLPTAKSKKPAKKLTKRMILSQIARIFDPLGFAAAFLIRAKVGMQELWQKGVDWDEELAMEDHDKWITLFEEMKQLNGVTFEMCLTPRNAVGRPTLCLFSDASQEAFGTCAYVRWTLHDGTYMYGVRFVAAKSRVAPLKQLTIPRLELQAAVLATRLGKTITEELRFQFEKVVYFLDSMIVLHWIRSQARSFKTFVSTRVGEIQSSSEPAQWKHIPGEVNVADDVYRGVSVHSLLGRWKSGPGFLSRPEEEWPQTVSVPEEKEIKKEQRRIEIICSVTTTGEVIDYKKFSNWRKLVRVTARILKLGAKIRRKREGVEADVVNEDGTLTPIDLKKAEVYWIKYTQRSLHKRIKDGELSQFSPFVDEEGIIRVGGRVNKALVTYTTRNIPPCCRTNTGCLSSLHVTHQQGHSGIASTAAKIRRKYWILRAHSLVKKVKSQCVFCKGMERRVESQVMADLPEQRLAPHTPPFYCTSCDYFGPYKVKIGRNETTKHYGVILSCLNTRAVHLELAVDHLELAVDYSAMGYLQVLRRFFSIRGYPKLMMSDNGTQLVGAETELREMVQGWEVGKLREFCSERGMIW